VDHKANVKSSTVKKYSLKNQYRWRKKALVRINFQSLM